jgi:hypothetical protein
MSSTDRILMAAQDMTDALKHPHTDFPFATIGDGTITALEKLSEIFTRQFKKQEKSDPTPEPERLHGIQRNVVPNASILSPQIQNNITETNPAATHFSVDTQPPPRVVTPATRRVSPPRVKARAQHLSPRNLSRDFLDLGAANCAYALGDNHWTKTPMMNSVIHPVTSKEMQYKDLMKDTILGPLFEIGLSNELGRICQGIRDIAGTNTAFFIDLTSIPKYRKITYGKLVCDFKTNKTEKHQVRLKVGGNRLDYSGDTAMSTADITTFKILINSTFSTAEAKMMMMDIKHYYLGTPLPTYEFTRLPLTILPQDIIEKYDLKRLAVNGWVYLEISKGMYGLKQAGLLANQLLQKRLTPFGYYPARNTPGLWLHNTKPTDFSLVVDDLAVKYVTKSDANLLRDALLQHYEITTDWEGTVYSGISLDWDYKKRTCNISMHGYITNVLNKFQHDAPRTPQNTPSKYITPVDGAKMQFSTQDNSPPLTATQCTEIHKITGSILYYSRAVDPTVVMALNDIATEQTSATEKTKTAPCQLLDYLATHPDTKICFQASDMILHIHSDASYLSV